jgi:hypothetical protein
VAALLAVATLGACNTFDVTAEELGSDFLFVRNLGPCTVVATLADGIRGPGSSVPVALEPALELRASIVGTGTVTVTVSASPSPLPATGCVVRTFVRNTDDAAARYRIVNADDPTDSNGGNESWTILQNADGTFRPLRLALTRP